MIIDVINVPIWLGCDINGSQFGPEELIKNGALEQIGQHATIHSITQANVPSCKVEDKYVDDPKMKYYGPIVKTIKSQCELADAAFSKGHFPLTLGGDHVLGIGSLFSVARHDPKTAVIWVDAHTDINTDETTPSGNMHGMPVAAGFGIGPKRLLAAFPQQPTLNTDHLYYFGVRSIDPGEQALLEQRKIYHHSVDECRKQGLASLLDALIASLRQQGIQHVHLSFDLDVFDQALVPGTNTSVTNGFLAEEGRLIIETLAASGLITSMDLVELNPKRDAPDHRTAKLGVQVLDWFFTAYQDKNKDS